jgi:hypothetical protein
MNTLSDITTIENDTEVELVPTLMIDDAETKMRTEASLLFELKTSVPFCHALQICELIYVFTFHLSKLGSAFAQLLSRSSIMTVGTSSNFCSCIKY